MLPAVSFILNQCEISLQFSCILLCVFSALKLYLFPIIFFSLRPRTAFSTPFHRFVSFRFVSPASASSLLSSSIRTFRYVSFLSHLCLFFPLIFVNVILSLIHFFSIHHSASRIHFILIFLLSFPLFIIVFLSHHPSTPLVFLIISFYSFSYPYMIMSPESVLVTIIFFSSLLHHSLLLHHSSQLLLIVLLIPFPTDIWLCFQNSYYLPFFSFLLTIATFLTFTSFVFAVDPSNCIPCFAFLLIYYPSLRIHFSYVSPFFYSLFHLSLLLPHSSLPLFLVIVFFVLLLHLYMALSPDFILITCI